MMKDASGSLPDPAPSITNGDEFHLDYSTVRGYFLQDDTSTDPTSFDFRKHAFGLKTRSYPSEETPPSLGLSQWQRFEYHLSNLNLNAPAGTNYRLLFLGRHGQGYHNVAEEYYGYIMWNCYWSALDGNETINWSDARLTRVGKGQAQDAHDFWKKMIQEQGMKTPDSFYVSPLDRAIQTANITFTGNVEAEKYHSTIKELLREGNGIHTCDRRSSKTVIASRWPEYSIEKGFTESDELWKPDLRESFTAMTERLRTLLDDVFKHDEATWISMTAHSGTIMSILNAVGHRQFPLQTGGVIPVLVKTVKKPGKRPPVQVEPWQPKPDCPSDPLQARAPGFGNFEEYWQSVGKDEIN
jgi:broad specificity phosphatase PhoE